MSQRHHWWSRFSPKCGSYIRNTIIVFESFRGHNRSVKCPSRIWFLHSRMGQDEKITTYLTLTLPPFRQPIQSPQSVGSAGPLLLWKKSQKWYSFSFSLKMMIWSYHCILAVMGPFLRRCVETFKPIPPHPEWKAFYEMYKIIIMKEMVLSEFLLSQTVCINWQFNK